MTKFLPSAPMRWLGRIAAVRGGLSPSSPYYATLAQMRRILLLVSLSFALTACGANFEGACKDFCDKSAECASEPTSDADLLECKNDCEEAELDGQAEIKAGTLTQACYDATTEVFSCVAGLSCTELRREGTAPECAEVGAEFTRACD